MSSTWAWYRAFAPVAEAPLPLVAVARVGASSPMYQYATSTQCTTRIGSRAAAIKGSSSASVAKCARQPGHRPKVRLSS